MLFSVTVEAEKNALVCFLFEAFQTGGDLLTDTKFFGAAVFVVEGEDAVIARIATPNTLSAEVFYERALVVVVPTTHAFAEAYFAFRGVPLSCAPFVERRRRFVLLACDALGHWVKYVTLARRSQAPVAQRREHLATDQGCCAFESCRGCLRVVSSADSEHVASTHGVGGSNPPRPVGEHGRLAQLGERLPYKQDATGSIPVLPICANIAQ